MTSSSLRRGRLAFLQSLANLPPVTLAGVASLAFFNGMVAAPDLDFGVAETCALAVALSALALAILAYQRLKARVFRMIEHVDYLQQGEEPPALGRQSDDFIGHLESGLGTLATHIASRNAALHAEARRQQLDAQIQRAVAMADTEADVVEIAGRALARVVPNSPAEILLSDAEQSELHLAAISATGASPGCPVEQPSGCAALRRGNTLRFNRSDDLDACPRLRHREDGLCSALCVPLSVMGRPIGVLHVTSTVTEPFTEDAVNALESVATHVGARLAMLNSLETVQAEAATDPLTGLMNRRSFEDAAQRVARDGLPFAVVVADLDHFKRLNDEHGHDAGDEALRVFARVLKTSFRPIDLVGRMGGEEFVIVLPRCLVEDAWAAVERARGALAMELGAARGTKFTASYGIAGFPQDGSSLESLIKAADEALYAAKRNGRDRATTYRECGAGGGIVSQLSAA